jgi:hypothetical protein
MTKNVVYVINTEGILKRKEESENQVKEEVLNVIEPEIRH